jgi:protein-tyrosine-phosphatase
LANSRPRSIADVLQADDFVITVCDTAHEELGRIDAIHWAVPDPVVVGTSEAFEVVYDEIVNRVRELALRLRAA